MQTILDSILDLLADGEWHSINEISTLEPLRKRPITTIMDFLNVLAEYDFIELAERTLGVPYIVEAKLTPPLQKFIKKIKWIERAELVSKP